jgi:hypothetical protein
LSVIMSAVSEDEPLLRAHRLHDALSRLSSAELGVLFGKALQVEDRARRSALLSVLLARWAIVDPTAVDVAVRPYLDRSRRKLRMDPRSADTAVCLAWAGALPERALTEAMTAPEARWAGEMARAAIGSLAEGDPVRQLELLAGLPASRLRDQMCKTAIEALVKKDCAAAEAHLDLLSEPRLRASVQSMILGKLAERDPAAALARLAAFAPDLKTGVDGFQLVAAVLAVAARKDPDAALEAVNGLPDGLKKWALHSALEGWAQGHLDDALAWAAANGVDQPDAKLYLSYVAFAIDRGKALAWLRTQPASSERDAMLRNGMWRATVEEMLQLYAELTPRGKAEAAAADSLIRSYFNSRPSSPADEIEPWINALPPSPARKMAIRQFAYFQAQRSGEVDALADRWASGPDRDAALRGISWFLSDPQRALDFARRIGAPETRESVFEYIAQSWFNSDESAARAWITGTQELSAEQKRVILRQFDER